ncbi:MAG: hypothetical protein CSYNP_01769 [Syntrophus sp. SKADARSKE-3]|nr:hypothetical protein [Syntrophus sp. SKADARSKE-3]
MLIFVGFLICLACLNTAFAEQRVVIRDDFHDLQQWEPLTFPKIKRHSTYAIVPESGKTVLKASSQGSASALVSRKTFNPYEYPRLRWRWKVNNVYRNIDGTVKSGDDYPIRVYVAFLYDPEKAGLGERIQYGALKAIYGKYPPHSTLNYVWASNPHAADVIASPFTDRARIVALEKGPANVGRWRDEAVHIIKDYEKAFGKSPPQTASLAIMNDSDNTGEAAVSYLEFIEVSK